MNYHDNGDLKYMVKLSLANAEKERKELTKVRQHVLKNKVEVKADEGCKKEIKGKPGSRCVDGRYKKDEAMGRLPRPGGDLGLSMALLAMDFTPQDAFKLVLEFRKNRGELYGWHSDHHANNGEIGCGHCQLSRNQANLYGYEANAIEKMLTLIQTEQGSERDLFDFANLEGDHQEAGIIIVNSKKYSVLPFDEQTNSQYFVYDQARDNELLKELAQHVFAQHQKENKITAKVKIDEEYQFKELSLEGFTEALIAQVNEHTNTTLSLLKTSQGQPMYTVDFDDEGNPMVQFTDYAPVADSQ